jgi:peptidoglycan-N-acetylmuramic acid deacetylase
LACLFTIFTIFSHHYIANATISSKSYGWGMPVNKKGQRPNPGSLYEGILAKHNAFWIDKTTEKRIYLTFDAGYEAGYTIQILDVLREHDVNATFFLTGDYLKKEVDIVKRIVKDGHIIGNHTWSHPDLSKITKEKYAEELKLFEDKYFEITNKQMMKIMRPPSGQFSDRSLQIADELGYTNIFWSLAFKDWEINNQHGWEYSYNNIMKRIHPGAIILLHNVSKDNADALERVIIDLRKDGYQFGSISQLLITRNLYV